MAVTKDQVSTNAKAVVEALSKLTSKERERTPSARYAKELNRLIDLAEEVAPDVDKRLWPVPVRVEEGGMQDQVFGRYEDIETAARQIVGQLADDSGIEDL